MLVVVRQVSVTNWKRPLKHGTGGVNMSKTIHGKSKSRIYRVWRNMLDRCERENDNKYNLYGGRGISVCKEWHNASDFINWAMSNGYADDLQLDRIDTNGDYDPENCRFVTIKENNRNKRNNRTITINDVSKTVTEWAEITGVKRKTIYERLNRGWDAASAVYRSVDNG